MPQQYSTMHTRLDELQTKNTPILVLGPPQPYIGVYRVLIITENGLAIVLRLEILALYPWDLEPILGKQLDCPPVIRIKHCG